MNRKTYAWLAAISGGASLAAFLLVPTLSSGGFERERAVLIAFPATVAIIATMRACRTAW